MVPVVFISYSHDTREHKAWVGSLAQRLREKGVDVLFDQWDLGPGDDVPKFMEQAVARADRVLMVCTEPYVRKADDGKGGVGYEAMVVTGELVTNLGTNKFIPIVRQQEEPKVRPRCVSTRFYVDLSEGPDEEENFEQLLREIHNAKKITKPPLGPNPFAPGHFDGKHKVEARAGLRLEFTETLATPEATYMRALDIIHEDDRVAWRRLLMAANEKSSEALVRWKTEKETIPATTGNDWTALYAHAREGVEAYTPLISCLVAAAETGKVGYADQLGWVESILNPSGYEKLHFTYHASFPQLIFFVTQALVGGMSMVSGSGDAAYRLATTKVSDRYESREAKPLYSMPHFTGWQESLNTDCTKAWRFLDESMPAWPWIKKAFGSDATCREGISAYYQLLSFLNFIFLQKAGQLDAEESKKWSFAVTSPLCFCAWEPTISDKGYKLFLNQSQVLKFALKSHQIEQSTFEHFWPLWIPFVGKWLGNVYRWDGHRLRVPQSKLHEDLKLELGA